MLRLGSRVPVNIVGRVSKRVTSCASVRKFATEHIVSPVLPFDSSKVPNVPFGKFLLDSYRQNPSWKDNVVMVDGGSNEALTFGQSHELIYKCASALRKLGAKNGYGVAIVSPNHLNYFPVFAGASLCGGYTVAINPLGTATDISYQLQHSEAKILFTHSIMLSKVLPVAKQLNLKVVAFDTFTSTSDVQNFSDFIANESMSSIEVDAFPPRNETFDVDSVAVIPFSSDTTGISKGVMLTHRNLITNILQAELLESKYLVTNSLGQRSTNLVPLPFFHIFGMMAGMCIPYYFGGKSVSIPSFDLKRFLELIQEHRVNRVYVAPPIVLALVKHPIVSNYDLSSLQCIISGAANLSADIRNACAKRLNCKVKEGWGMTVMLYIESKRDGIAVELSPLGTAYDDVECDHPSAIKGSCGKLAPGTEGKIVDALTGEDQHYTKSGEILIRGPQVMKGYLKNADATKSTIRPDGWMHTGDIGHFDSEGWLFITDRSKELIKYKGYQVPPAELEAVILTMPEVKDAIVIPVLDEEAGEIPRAYVVKQDNCPSTFTEQDVVNYVNSKVANQKKLRGGAKFTTSIPKSAAGKVLRRIQVQIDRGEINP